MREILSEVWTIGGETCTIPNIVTVAVHMCQSLANATYKDL